MQQALHRPSLVPRGFVVESAYYEGDKAIRTHTRPCVYQEELDLHTLVWTRGRNFPLARLESRLMCPRCGCRRVVIVFQPPAEPLRKAAKRA
jgi:hypothetical protein